MRARALARTTPTLLDIAAASSSAAFSSHVVVASPGDRLLTLTLTLTSILDVSHTPILSDATQHQSLTSVERSGRETVSTECTSLSAVVVVDTRGSNTHAQIP